MKDTKNQKAIDAFNRTMELELAGVVRYTQYALMVYGYNRIPIVSWLKATLPHRGNRTRSLERSHAR